MDCSERPNSFGASDFCDRVVRRSRPSRNQKSRRIRHCRFAVDTLKSSRAEPQKIKMTRLSVPRAIPSDLASESDGAVAMDATYNLRLQADDEAKCRPRRPGFLLHSRLGHSRADRERGF